MTEADLSLYEGYFQPSEGGSCVVMTVEDRQLRWLDIDCNALQHNDQDFGLVCQCKGADCEAQSPPTSTTPKMECSGDWIDAGGLGCVRFLRKVSLISGSGWENIIEFNFSDEADVDRHGASKLCSHHGGYLVETKTQEDIEFVSTMAAITDTFTGINSWWIGLEKNGSEWMWSSSGEALGDLDNWGEGEEESGETEVCVVLSQSEDNFSWRSVQCNLTSPSLAGVCQCPAGSECSASHFPLGCHQGYDQEECYVLVNTAMTWSQAEQFCGIKGGHLASITSEEENDWLGSELMTYDSVWVGGRWSNGTDWSWTDGTEWDWTHWATDQPRLHYDTECALLHQTTYDWASYYCDTEMKFLCKYSNTKL